MMAAKSLLIHDAPEAIQSTWAILDFTILAQDVLHHDKMLRYMKHALYRLEKTKMAHKNHMPIDSKLSRPTFNYPKFNAMRYFVLWIWDYSSDVNYDTAHSKIAYKYFFKTFYNKINKKKYDLQIRQHNVNNTNIIAVKDVIIIEKAR